MSYEKNDDVLDQDQDVEGKTSWKPNYWCFVVVFFLPLPKLMLAALSMYAWLSPVFIIVSAIINTRSGNYFILRFLGVLLVNTAIYIMGNYVFSFLIYRLLVF